MDVAPTVRYRRLSQEIRNLQGYCKGYFRVLRPEEYDEGGEYFDVTCHPCPPRGKALSWEQQFSLLKADNDGLGACVVRLGRPATVV